MFSNTLWKLAEHHYCALPRLDCEACSSEDLKAWWVLYALYLALDLACR